MTIEEARKFLMNKKVFVKNKSKEIQLKLFELGFRWQDPPFKEARFRDYPFLYINENTTLIAGHSVTTFYKDSYKEISAEDILNIKVEHLPKTWKEFCENNPIKAGEVVLSMYPLTAGRTRDPEEDRYSLPSCSAAKAHRALIQLHQLRDCYRGNVNPSACYYSIVKSFYDAPLTVIRATDRFLSFPTEKMAEEFGTNFKNLIKEAGDLI